MVPYAKRMEKMAFTANVVKGLFGSMTNPDIISFSGGSPAREALPVDTIRQLADEVLRTDTRGVEALQYGPIEGIRDLREVVVRELLAPKGIDCGVDNGIIITGGLEGINLACQAYIDPGDVILVEAPTFVQSVEIFDMFEAKCVGVAMDDDGLIPEDLERKIRQCHPKMIYVIPTFQNPSGRTLSLERRKAVAELAAKYDVLVLEDDPYRDIRYSGEDLPPIKHFDTTGHVVMAGSFSKIFSPGSRLGYVVADTETIQHLVDVKSATNSHLHAAPDPLRGVLQAGLLPGPPPDDLRPVPQAPGRDAPEHRPVFPRRYQAQQSGRRPLHLGGAARRHRHLRPAAGVFHRPGCERGFCGGRGLLLRPGRPGEELYAHELRQHAGGPDRGGCPPPGRADLLQAEQVNKEPPWRCAPGRFFVHCSSSRVREKLSIKVSRKYVTSGSS